MFATVEAGATPVAASLDEAISAFQEVASSHPSAGLIAEALRAADRLQGTALSMLSALRSSAPLGMSPELMLRTVGNRTFGASRALSTCAAVLPSMPETSAALSRGDLSFDQVRAVCTAARPIDPRSRVVLDQIATAPADDADTVVAKVESEAARMREDILRAKEDRAVARSFLAVQDKLDGSGSIYAEADAASLATIVGALDAVAARPVSADADGPTRARQRFDALLAICEARLNGEDARSDGGDGAPAGQTVTRPRPRLLATIDAGELARGEGAARLLWALAGRTPRLSTVATDTLLCDAEVQPVLFDGAVPIDVGPVIRTVPGRLRTALIARDGRCRFPGCRAPVAWTDVHHIVSPLKGGTTDARNCVLLCRRCHRLVHRFAWKIEMHRDGTIAFTRRAETLRSPPHHPMRA